MKYAWTRNVALLFLVFPVFAGSKRGQRGGDCRMQPLGQYELEDHIARTVYICDVEKNVSHDGTTWPSCVTTVLAIFLHALFSMLWDTLSASARVFTFSGGYPNIYGLLPRI